MGHFAADSAKLELKTLSLSKDGLRETLISAV